MTLVRVAAALVSGALVFGPNDLNSCSFEPLHPVFTAQISREGPAKDFAKGDLGILLPPFPRVYLTVAYRYLNGATLTDQQTAALTFERRVAPGTPTTSGAEEWRDAHMLVDKQQQVYVNPYKEDPEQHLFFLNCKEDAFRAAAAALQALIKAYGANSERVKQWTAAQDIVFQNCNAGPAIPQPLNDAADSLAKADRTYQIAAAHFYSGQYDAARADFAAIARDAGSPWRGLAPYLIARTMIRQGDLPGAEKQVQEILKDPKQAEGHERADHLEAWLKIRLYPAQRLSETAKAVMDPHPADFQQTVMDYTYLFDQLEAQPGALEKAAELSDLTDWILDFQHSDPVDGHALERWHATHATPWLIAALASRPDDAAARAEVLKAADQLPRQSPGYLTAQYYAVGMLDGDAARRHLDQALAANPPRAARNLLLAARMRLARNWPEFLRDAQRQPVSVDGYDYSVAGPNASHTVAEVGFDADGVAALNHLVPLSLEAGAALDDKLPPDIQRELAIAAWTKAVLLKRFTIARSLSPVLVRFYPTLRVDLQSDSDFAAALAMLRNPGVHPYVEPGFGRLMKVDRLDEFRDNWWCADAPDLPLGYALSNLYGQEKPSSAFLSAAERETGKSEDDALRALPGGPDWLASETLEFAKSNAGDARVPEALHLAVRASRYGCVSPKTSAFSKEAFETLHQHYPNSEWAKKTPYWFTN
jgi:hypothetical protein